MEAEVLRSWWASRQRLDGSARGASPADVLAAAGWARSVGGAGPYLSLHARSRTTKAEADAAVASLAIHELPSARGCTYVVPAEHFALALVLSQGTVGELGTVKRLGVPESEVEQLADAVVEALAGRALDPADLREVLGDQVRRLGEEGKKKGASTTLPAALGLLQTQGRIRRVPINGRLDQQRYRYVRWDDGPLADGGLWPGDARAELARLFFTWASPATLDHFRWFSGLGVKAAKAAITGQELVPVAGPTDGYFMLADDAKEMAAFIPPRAPCVELVAGIDGVALLRRDAEALIDVEDRDHPLLAGLGAGGGLMDLPAHAIIDRGRLIGVWEFDPDAGSIVWATFGSPNEAVRKAVADTEAFVVGELGDARSSSLDSPASRRSRIDAIWAFSAP